MSSKETRPCAHYEPVTIRSAADLRAVLSLGSSLMITTRRRPSAVDTAPAGTTGPAGDPDRGCWPPPRSQNG